MAPATVPDRFSSRYVNLALPRLGARAIFASDEFFAPCARMLNVEPAVFVPGKFDDHGKWMDGWESRRKRVEGYDYCVVRLGLPGVIHGVDIDTSHFVGNHPPSASLDACDCKSGDPGDDAAWVEVLPAVNLNADSHHLHEITDSGTFSHVRLNIYPDGGIARLRVYGSPQYDWHALDDETLIDLVAVEHGGRPVASSNESFGSSAFNLLMPGRGVNMGDGWETARRRVPGNDWVIVELGSPGIVSAIELDTAHYKGNYPDRASVQASLCRRGTEASLVTQSQFWPTLLPEQKLEMDAVHRYEAQLAGTGVVSHVRINIIPDGGLSRVRLFGFARG